MKILTIFYDARCGLCSTFRRWMEGQELRVPVEFLDYESDEARSRFPSLPEYGPEREIVVLSDDGCVWQGEEAWLICLGLTMAYEAWGDRMSSPVLRPVLRKFVRLVSENRYGLSKIIRLRSDVDLARRLDVMDEPGCGDGQCVGASSVVGRTFSKQV